MAAAIADDSPVPVTPAEARDTVLVIELALKSAHEARVVQVGQESDPT